MPNESTIETSICRFCHEEIFQIRNDGDTWTHSSSRNIFDVSMKRSCWGNAEPIDMLSRLVLETFPE